MLKLKSVLILLILLPFTILLSTPVTDSLLTNLKNSTGIDKAIIYLDMASLSNVYNTEERINYCKSAHKIAVELNNHDLLVNVLNLEASIYKQDDDIENYSATLQELIKIQKINFHSEMESYKKQISKQIYIRNAFMIGFLIFLNIAFVIFARYRLKTSDQISLEKANKKLNELSRKDPLTGVSNRRGILEKIEYEKIRFERNKNTFCLVMGDIDHFKSVNDTYGHECGDYILIELVNTIISGLRKQDVVSRWGGEEFIILLPETQLTGGEVAAEKIRRKIAQNKFVYQDKTIPITITFGVSEFALDKTIEDCVKEADTALYKGKKQGRNRVEVFDPNNVLIG